MRVVSFDQSSRCSGYCLFQDGQYVESGMIDMSKSKLETNERSFEMAKEIWKIIKKYKPQYVVLEDVSQQANPKVMMVLARLQGMVLGYAEAHGVKVKIVLPSKWRAALQYSQGPKVKREELKKQSINYIKEHLGLDVAEDEAEAIAEGIAAHKIFNFE